jgi:hypothetical protein
MSCRDAAINAVFAFGTVTVHLDQAFLDPSKSRF